MSDHRADRAADPRIGTRVGGYEIDGLVAVGGMGMIYRATGDDGTRVALKIVKDDLAQDETARRRFRLEAKIAWTVRNPHLVPIIDAGEQDGLPFMVERFIDGSSLHQTLRLLGRLDLKTAVGICADVADGLEALWAAGVVHRDVKPGNILLDRAGTAYLTDFGLAKNTHGQPLTQPGHTLGSLAYMAPEQIRGEPVTSATDMYSLGCVMFECVQGRPPFADRESLSLLWAHLKELPPDPTAGRDDVPAEFVQVLKAALEKDPDQRPRSALAYAAALSESAGDRLAKSAH